MRTADAAGVDAVIVPRHGAAGLGPTVSKVAAGAAEQLPFAAVANLGKVLGWLGDYGIRRIGTSDRADAALFDADLSGSVALVMGREHTGLSKGIASRCDALVSLPMEGVGLILVTHSPSQVRQLCTRAAVMDQGTLTFYEDIDEALATYNSL